MNPPLLPWLVLVAYHSLTIKTKVQAGVNMGEAQLRGCEAVSRHNAVMPAGGRGRMPGGGMAVGDLGQ